ncbi:MAG: hypothetical protein IPJ55_15990 [Chloracidobacterium sp.]|nr:hypothetical protein [Chloracidobacterium sp.]
MGYRVLTRKWVTRTFVREHRDHIFLFGDNLVRRGLGGQASAMRGEPNVVGIPTKKLPSNNENAFFTDAELAQNKAAISQAFEHLTRKSTGPDRSSSFPQMGSEPAGPNSKPSTAYIRLFTKASRETFFIAGRSRFPKHSFSRNLRGFSPE